MSGLPEHLLEPVEARIDTILERVARARSAPPLGPDTRSDLDRVLAAAEALRERLRALAVGELPLDDPRVRHDLRTPLNHVLGYGEMLAQEAGDEGRDDLHAELDGIVRAGREILERLDDVLAAARAARGAAERPRRIGRAAVLAFDLPAFDAALPDTLGGAPELVAALVERARRHGLRARTLYGARHLLIDLDGDVVRAARCALELVEAARAAGGEVRVGLHVGELFAVELADGGVDVWGPVPALALRIEAAGAPDAVTLSEAAWEALFDRPGAQAASVGALRRDGRPPVVLYRLQALA